MRKILIILLIASATVNAQTEHEKVDSMSYALFLNQEWDKLILTAQDAFANNIDFKHLRQRAGYAYFSKGEFYKAIYHYEKSLSFDPYDEISHLYLYYSGLNTGNRTFALFHASKLPTETQASLGLKSFRIVDVVDAEYNKKFNNNILRSDPDYMRIGLNTQLAYRLQLYQSVSRYSQTFSNIYYSVQNEYFALVGISLSDRTNLKIGYHAVNTSIDSSGSVVKIPANMFYGKLKFDINRFDLGISTSVFSNSFVTSVQSGIEAGVTLPGRHFPYLKTSLYNMNEYDANRIIFSQSAGMLFAKKFWAEASVTLGNLNNYVDAEGLYLYNSFDHTTFRTGASLFWYINKNLTVYSNYTFDKKLVIYDLSTYNQNSVTGGIIWKL